MVLGILKLPEVVGDDPSSSTGASCKKPGCLADRLVGSGLILLMLEKSGEHSPVEVGVARPIIFF